MDCRRRPANPAPRSKLRPTPTHFRRGPLLSIIGLIAGALGLRSWIVWAAALAIALGALFGVCHHIRSRAAAERDQYWQAEMAAERERIARENAAALEESR